MEIISKLRFRVKCGAVKDNVTFTAVQFRITQSTSTNIIAVYVLVIVAVDIAISGGEGTLSTLEQTSCSCDYQWGTLFLLKSSPSSVSMSSKELSGSLINITMMSCLFVL
ncbi:hypothetical protein RRG08_009802 [Elysia crispata]|uniref:Uncharacterized protein n=1 Tax=Elysia crispata TaxID=231223 RepID=A0AAE1CPX8_9GAST|nr:hypothetical protein RRG08_009802 [Elysia crispata]